MLKIKPIIAFYTREDKFSPMQKKQKASGGNPGSLIFWCG